MRSLKNYDLANFVAPYRSDLEFVDFFVMDSPKLVQGNAKANELRPNRRLTEREIRDLIVFLHMLTVTSSIDLRSDVPSAVPSGLRIYELTKNFCVIGKGSSLCRASQLNA